MPRQNVVIRLDEAIIAELDAEPGTRTAAIRRRIDEHRRILAAHRAGYDVRPIVAMIVKEEEQSKNPTHSPDHQ